MDIGRILTDVLIVLAASRVAAEISERFRQPAVLGEIALGIAIGPAALGLVHDSEPLRVLGEIGVILLLFEVGRQMDLGEMRRVGAASLRVAVIGVVAPMGLGYVAMRGLGIAPMPSLFLAAAITATSVGITARVFGDLKALATPEARTVLGAAVADDVIGLMVLTVVAAIAGGEHLAAAQVGSMVAVAVGFVAFATVAGAVLLPRMVDWIARMARTEGTVMVAGLVVALGLARLAGAAKLAPIIGAFIAGLAIGRSDSADQMHRKLTPLGHFFIPIFFLKIGIDTNVRVFGSSSVLGIAAVLSVCAIAGKLISGMGVPRGSGDRRMIGIAMIPRGEVGLIFASIGLASGILDSRLYGVLLAVVLVTTVVTPPWVRRRIARKHQDGTVASRGVVEPEGGWLAIDETVVDLVADPPAALAPRIALEAAVACASRRPGPRLIDWLVSVEPAAAWDSQLRRAFLAVLRSGSERSWRLLQATGFVTHMLPAVAAALERRPRDPFDLAPEAAPGYRIVAAVRAIAASGDFGRRLWSGLDDPDSLLLAALARDVFASSRDPAAEARALATLIGMTHFESLAVGFLAGERHVLPAAAARAALDEDLVVDLSVYIQTPERAAGLFLLALAEGEREAWETERLEAMHELIAGALAAAGGEGPSARELVERRAVEVAALMHRPVDQIRRRLAAAPRRSLQAHDAVTLARHLDMTETRPGRFESRLTADFAGDDRWTVHVALLDRQGVLAAIAESLTAAGAGVTDADIATWRNGIAVDVFHVSAAVWTDWDAVRRRLDAALTAARSPECTAAVEGVLTLDNLASPWHSIVEVRARDRAGLLSRVATAMSAAGLHIHHATVATDGTQAIDRFLVTGPTGGKLDAAGERRLRAAFAGRRPRRLGVPWRRTAAAAIGGRM